MAVVTDKEERPCFGHIDLHPDEPVRVAGQMVQRDALAEIHTLVVERFPVPATVNTPNGSRRVMNILTVTTSDNAPDKPQHQPQ